MADVGHYPMRFVSRDSASRQRSDEARTQLGWATFEDFYQAEHAGQVRRAFLILGNNADAAEAVSEAFVAVLTRWDRLFDPGPYLNVCVANACRDVARKNKRTEVERPEFTARGLQTGAAHTDNDHLGAAHMGGAHPAGVGAEIEMAELLLALPFQQRAAIVMRYYGGMTEKEIAEALGCRPGSVGPTIHRALAKLRGALS